MVLTSLIATLDTGEVLWQKYSLKLTQDGYMEGLRCALFSVYNVDNTLLQRTFLRYGEGTSEKDKVACDGDEKVNKENVIL